MKQMDLARQAYAAGKFKEAFDIWLPIAERGETEAQAWIGSLYEKARMRDSTRTSTAWMPSANRLSPSSRASNVGWSYRSDTTMAVSPAQIWTVLHFSV